MIEWWWLAIDSFAIATVFTIHGMGVRKRAYVAGAIDGLVHKERAVAYLKKAGIAKG